jgi:diketogulonate reductase-like aldo/keto reductase
VIPAITLNNGVEMPEIGLGTIGNRSDEKMLEIVRAAVDAGYRSFDTATRYDNERALGRAFDRCGIPRDELFVTTKVWNSDHGRTRTLRALDRSLQQLGLDYVDLYLIHFPAPKLGLFLETWLTLEDLYLSGRARAIGVASFGVSHLERILDGGSIVPAVNQIELHPRWQQKTLRAFNEQHGIQVESWSPLGMGGALYEPVLAAIATKHDATPAQVILRWHMQQGRIVIPRSTSPSRIRENVGAVTIDPLDDGDLSAIDALDTHGRIGPDPDEWSEDDFDMRPRVSEVYGR